MIPERAVPLVAADGTALEGRLAVPAAPTGGLVLCHPHPLYGGDMDNPVVVRLAEVGAALGWATLRFNFRGVGASGGRYDEGHGEQGDVEAAWARLAEVVDRGPRVLAGYSFGATVAAATAPRLAHLAGLILVAPPLAAGGLGPVASLADLPAPVLVVAAGRDEFCPPPALAALRRTLPRATVTVLDEATHFFFGKLYPLGEAVRAWAAGLEAGQARGRS